MTSLVQEATVETDGAVPDFQSGQLIKCIKSDTEYLPGCGPGLDRQDQVYTVRAYLTPAECREQGNEHFAQRGGRVQVKENLGSWYADRFARHAPSLTTHLRQMK